MIEHFPSLTTSRAGVAQAHHGHNLSLANYLHSPDNWHGIQNEVNSEIHSLKYSTTLSFWCAYCRIRHNLLYGTVKRPPRSGWCVNLFNTNVCQLLIHCDWLRFIIIVNNITTLRHPHFLFHTAQSSLPINSPTDTSPNHCKTPPPAVR